MSSILDALKKLEAEKVQARKRIEGNAAEQVPERELVGRHVARGRQTVRLTPVTFVLGLIVLAVAVVGTSVGVSMILIARTGQHPADGVRPIDHGPYEQADDVAASSTPAPPASPATSPPAGELPAPSDAQTDGNTPLPPPVAEPKPQESSVAASVEPTAGPPPAEQKAPEIAARVTRPPAPGPPTPASVSTQVPAPASPPPSVGPSPEPGPSWQGPMMQTLPRPASGSPPKERKASTPQPSLDMATLARRPLRETDKRRLGLTGLQINMLQPVNKNRPHASAIINLNKVYLGEMIPRTSAKLIAVDGLEGIAIEIRDTKEQFYVPF